MRLLLDTVELADASQEDWPKQVDALPMPKGVCEQDLFKMM
jgi:hypothetical protein